VQINEYFLGRQPILDRSQAIVAYELLFRSGNVSAANVTDDLRATASVITHAFGELGLNTVLGENRGFINVSTSLLMSDMIELLPREHVVLELLETVEINEPVVKRCKALKKMGFSLAMDDVVAFEERHEPLLGIVDVVKLDMTLIEPSQLEKLALRLKFWPIQLLAEKVDTREQVDQCMKLGFDLFQGYYFAKPVVLSGKRADPSKLALLKLLGLLLSDADNHDIEQAFKQNPKLTYNLLRLVNSVASGVARKISSLSQAIVVLGRRQLQRWLQLLLYSMEQGSGAGYPGPLMQLAATRSRMMEILAREMRPSDRAFQDKAFMTGIMSLLDALLDISVQDIVAELNLEEDVKSALMARQGNLGLLLRLAEAIEQSDYAKAINTLAECPGLTLEDLTTAQVEAMGWVNDFAASVNQ
jgi:c-di-GMP-related signal transduction protein